MRNLWTFGDSYTAGEPINFNDHFAKKYGVTLKTIWPALLADRLNLNLINKAKGGEGNEYIIKSICENLHKIEKDDFVVIGLSNPMRIEVFDWINNKSTTVNPGLHVEGRPIKYGDTKGEYRGVKSPYSLFRKKSLIGDVDIRADKLTKVLMKYLMLIKTEGQEYHRQRDIEVVYGLQKELNKRGIKSLLWSWWLKDYAKELNMYSTIPKDGHWTGAGHRDFFKRISKQIDNNVSHWYNIFE